MCEPRQAVAALSQVEFVEDLLVFTNPVGADREMWTDGSLLPSMKRLRVRLRDVCHTSGMTERAAFRELAGHEPMGDRVMLTVRRLLQVRSLVQGCLLRLCIDRDCESVGIGLLASRWFDHPFRFHLPDVSPHEWDQYVLRLKSQLADEILETALPFLKGPVVGSSVAAAPGGRDRELTERNANPQWLLAEVDDLGIPLLDIALAGRCHEIDVFRQLSSRDTLTTTIRRTVFRLLEYHWIETDVLWDSILPSEHHGLLTNVGSYFPDTKRSLGALTQREWEEELDQLEQAFAYDCRRVLDPRNPEFDTDHGGLLTDEASTLDERPCRSCWEAPDVDDHMGGAAG